jgi:hypothetical protein
MEILPFTNRGPKLTGIPYEIPLQAAAYLRPRRARGDAGTSTIRLRPRAIAVSSDLGTPLAGIGHNSYRNLLKIPLRPAAFQTVGADRTEGASGGKF